MGRESGTNAKAKYSSSVLPPDPSVLFYHCCLHSMRCRVYVTVSPPSARLSVCLSQLSTAAAACGGFAARPGGRRSQSIAARPAPSSNGAAAARLTAAKVSSVVSSRRRRLNGDLFEMHNIVYYTYVGDIREESLDICP